MSIVSTQLAFRAVELLGDGEWHDYEQTVRELMKLIPPGIAKRKVEARRKAGMAQRRAQGIPKGTLRPTPVDEQVRSGKRQYVTDFLGNARIFEREKLDGHRPKQPRQTRYGPTVRMIAAPRSLNADVQRARADRLELEVVRLHDQVLDLRKYLVEIGHADAAERLAPETDPP